MSKIVFACCPACGDPIDYCQGHGESGDPKAFIIIERHDIGKHDTCHYNSDCKSERGN